MKKLKIALIIIFTSLLLLVIAAIVVISSLKVKPTPTISTDGADQTTVSQNNVKNIVFLGIDDEENRSDVIMVTSINLETNVVNIISLLRDSKVTIDGCRHGTKLGYAYKWGGVDLALATINQNFHTDFSDYIAINFAGMESFINALGGVEITLNQNEADIINDWFYTPESSPEYLQAGVQKLTGAQAIVFSRIRKIDGEYARASRQQIVISAMLEAAKQISPLSYPFILNDLMKCVETNLVYSDFLRLIVNLNLQTLELNKYTIPDENYETDLWGDWETVENYDASIDFMIDPVQWVWTYDLESASVRLHNILYGTDTDSHSHDARKQDEESSSYTTERITETSSSYHTTESMFSEETTGFMPEETTTERIEEETVETTEANTERSEETEISSETVSDDTTSETDSETDSETSSEESEWTETEPEFSEESTDFSSETGEESSSS